MDFTTLVTEARSCRRFVASEPVSHETIERLINCARLAPSAKNQQALRFMVVDSAEGRQLMRLSLGWAGALPEWGGPAPEEWPAAYIVICAQEGAGKMVHIDLGITGQTLQLAAASENLAACMFLSFNAEKMAPLLRLPTPWNVQLVLALGKPLEKRRIVPVPENGRLGYWREADGTHNVPKLELATLILGYR